MGQLLSDSGVEQLQLGEIENQSASKFNKGGYFEDSTFNLCLDNLIRFTHGFRNSFIFNKGMKPNREVMIKNLKNNFDSEYDLNENTVEVPANYEDSLLEYTGHDWDVWGLTRMSEGGKWHRAYSRAEVETGRKAFDKFVKLYSRLEVTKNSFVKDPRMIYLLPLVDVSIPTVLVKRKPEKILESMKNHYGPNLFSRKVVYADWVSNHFNYAIQPQDFEEFYSTYLLFEEYARHNMNVEEIAYENLQDTKELQRLSKFVGKDLNWRVSE